MIDNLHFYTKLSLLLMVFLPFINSCTSADEVARVTSLPVDTQALQQAISFQDPDGAELDNILANVEHQMNEAGEIISGSIAITGPSNVCVAPPCEAAEANIAVLAFDTSSIFDVLTGTEANSATFTHNIEEGTATLSIPDPLGATNTPSLMLGTLSILYLQTLETVTYTITADYTGTPVSAIVNSIVNDSITKLMTATFNDHELTAAFSDSTTLTLSGVTNTDADSATGTIRATETTSLPAGYTVTDTSGALYNFDDPDNDGIDGINGRSLAAISIAERDTTTDGIVSAVVNENEESYSVTLSLAELLMLESEHFSFTLTDDTQDAPQVTVNHAGKEITITVLTNACSLPPCITAEETDIATFTLIEAAAIFTVDSSSDIFTVDSLAVPLPDQLGAVKTSDVALGNVKITRTGDNVDITYAVIAHYKGTPAAELVSALGGIGVVLPADEITVSFGEQSSTAAWSGNDLTIDDIVNLPDDAVSEGSVSLPTVPSLPAGYYVKIDTLTFDNPDGTAASPVTVSQFMGIAEGDEDTTSVIDGNEVLYNLNVDLADLPVVALSLADLSISVTNTLLAETRITTSQLSINLENKVVTITAAANIPNFNENVHTTETGELSLAAAAGSSIIFDITDLSDTFSDPTGTEATTTNMGTFDATVTPASDTYTLILNLAPSYNIKLDSTTVAAEQTGQSYTIDRCAKLSGSVFTLDAASRTNTLDDAAINTSISYYYDSATPANNTNNQANTLSAISASGSPLGDFTVEIIVQECTAASANFAGGHGTATDPWLIDNDLRLDLMSRLVNGDEYATYGYDSYKLIAELDMGDANAPWSETSGHPQINTNGFVPIGKRTNVVGVTVNESALSNQTKRFRGQLDCAAYNIANLYISNTNAIGHDYDGFYIGLFAVITATSTSDVIITNCTLTNASITGSANVGGLVGYQVNGTISGNTVASTSIQTGNFYVGGLVGQLANGAISGNHVSNVDITNSMSGTGGGITGRQNNGTIHNNVVSSTSIAGYFSAGGLVGSMAAGTNSHNFVAATVEATGASAYVGGLVGSMAAGTNSHNFVAATVEATAGASAYAGGLVGSLTSGDIENSAFSGTVTTPQNSGLSSGVVVNISSTTNVNINNVYTAVVLSGSINLGIAFNNTLVTGSYWDSILASGAAGEGNGSGEASSLQSTSALQTPTAPGGSGEVYEGWSADVWDFGTSSEYPALKNLPLTAAQQRLAGANYLP